MHAALFDQVPLCCPGCLQRGETGVVQHPLTLEDVFCREQDHIIEGILRCTGGRCRRTYPIVSGIPILMKNLSAYWCAVQGDLSTEWGRSDEIREYLRQAAEAGQCTLAARSRLSATIGNHFGEAAAGQKPPLASLDPHLFWKRIAALLHEGGQRFPLALDLGCAAGRLTGELSRISGAAVGVDSSLDALVFAEQLHRQGQAVWKRRIRGRRFETQTIAATPRDNLCFVAADALNPPFPAGTFDLVAGLNLLDSVRLPLTLLGQMDALLPETGRLLIGSPYEWRSDICDPIEWLEREAQDAPSLVRGLLEGKLRPETGFRYRVIREVDRLPWFIRNHDRYWSLFFVHLIWAEKRQLDDPAGSAAGEK